MFPRMSHKEAMQEILKTLMDKNKMTTVADFKKVKTEFLKHPSNTITKFNYGVALIHSKDKESKEEGLAVLTALLDSLDEQHSKLCLYHLCFGCFSLEKFALVKQYGELLLAAGNADDLEGQKLKALVTLSEEFIQNPSLWHVLDKKGLKKGKESKTKKPIQKKLSFMEKLMSFVDSSTDDKENIINFGSSSDLRSSEKERWNETGRLYRSDTVLYEKEKNIGKDFLSEEQTRKRTFTRTSFHPLQNSNKRFKTLDSRDFDFDTSEGMNAMLGGLKSRASGSEPQVDVRGLQQTFEHLQTMYEDAFPSESPGEVTTPPPPNPLHLQPLPSAIELSTISSASIIDRALITNKPLPEPKCDAIFVTPQALPSAASRKLFSPKPWVIIRRYGMRGGKKIRLPHSLEALLCIGSSAFRVQVVAVREATTEAQIEDLECITGECVLWMMTQEDEKLFS